MRPALKILVVFLIIMVTFGLPIILQQVINPNRQKNTTLTPTPIETVAIDDIRFISVPPVLVAAKSTFMYKILATSISGNEVTLSILAKPDWMQWDPTSAQLIGLVPDVGGVFTVTLRAATIAGDMQDQTFTVTVDKMEDVKGAKTIGIWKDPFHPNITDINARDEQLLSDVTTATQDITSQNEVLGEKTTAVATKVLNDQQQQYLLIALVVVLSVIIVSILIKIVKAVAGTRSKLPAGIVIERGGR